MADMTIPTVGKALLAQYASDKASPTNLKLHLFSNDATIDADTVIGDLTECTAAGTAAKTLTAASWSAANPSEYAAQTFTITEAEPTIYGAYITDSAGTGLIAAIKFADGPYVIPAGGGTVTITPAITAI